MRPLSTHSPDGMHSREIVATCGICGDPVRSTVGAHWKPGTRALRAFQAMQAHLDTHSFAELLRFEIRQDLDQVPEEQRPSILRDVYRGLLGSFHESGYTLDAADGVSAYTIDEALGDAELYAAWLSANRCSDPHCRQHAS
jgi:hypothetical protein